MSPSIRVALALALAAAAVLTSGASASQQAPARCPTGTSTGAPVAIAPTACLSVGVLSGDPMQELDRVVTPFLMRDGSLAVPTTGASSIRIFGADGRFVRELGGYGEGPGEFEYLASAWTRGDTIEAFDLTQQRMVRFFPGDSAETLALRGAPASVVHGTLGGGWATSRLQGQMGARDVHRVRSMTRTSEGFDTAVVAVTEGMHREQAPGISGPHPLTPTAVVAVHRDQIYVGETLTPLIRVYDANGNRIREIALALPSPTRIADTHRQVVEMAVEAADDTARVFTRRRWEGYRAPERLSVFWALIVDELGFIWVRPYEPLRHSLALDGLPSNRGGPGGRWLVLSPTGAQIGWVDVPEGFEPLSITRDAVVGVHRDALDVESVRVHRLTRR